jgi:hypothetical protein
LILLVYSLKTNKTLQPFSPLALTNRTLDSPGQFFLALLSTFYSIKFWHPFNGFDYSPLPKNIEEYQAYKINVIDFLTARNQRILIPIQ